MDYRTVFCIKGRGMVCLDGFISVISVFVCFVAGLLLIVALLHKIP